MKNLHLVALLALTALPGAAQAHQLWVETAHTHGGEVLEADLGYGHNFILADIPAPRLHIFSEPMQLIGKGGKVALRQTGPHNYHFSSVTPVAEGSYLVTASYQPTFWSKNAAGEWAQKNLKDNPGAVYCEMATMYGKNILNVGHKSAERDVIARPTGAPLEIVPLANPAALTLNDTMPLQVLLDGEPLAGATVTATFKGFDRSVHEGEYEEAQAFSATTDNQGKVNLIMLRNGFWKVSVTNTTPYKDKAVCQDSVHETTLTFQMGSGH